MKQTLMALLTTTLVACSNNSCGSNESFIKEETVIVRPEIVIPPERNPLYDNNNVSLDESVLRSVIPSIEQISIEFYLPASFSFDNMEGEDIRHSMTCSSTVLFESSGWHYVLTANHCATPLNPIGIPFDNITQIEFSLGNITGGEVIAHDYATDSALLRFPANDRLHVLPVPLGNSNSLEAGDYIYSIGYPRGMDKEVSDGIVRGVRTPGPFFNYDKFMYSASGDPGNSGGPIFAVSDGQLYLVGITSAFYPHTNDMYIGSGITPIMEILRRQAQDYSSPTQMLCPIETMDYEGQDEIQKK